MPFILLAGAPDTVRALHSHPSSIVVRVLDDHAYLCRNDATLGVAESALLDLNEIDERYATWVARVSETGRCSLLLVDRLPASQAELAALPLESGAVLTARVESGWGAT